MKTKEKVSEDLKEKLREEWTLRVHGGHFVDQLYPFCPNSKVADDIEDFWLSKLDSYTAKGLGRRGGLKRWKNVSKKKRSELGRELVLKRWKKLKELTK